MYGRALKEVLEVLDNMDKEYTTKISQDFMKIIIDNADFSYEFVYDNSKSLEEQNISEEARCILAIIYFRYFAKEDEKQELIAKMKQNDIDSENLKRQKYNPDNIFVGKPNETIEDLKEEVALVKVPEKWYKRMFEKIKNFFRK